MSGTIRQYRTLDEVMNTTTALLDKPLSAPVSQGVTRAPEPLLREALGLTLRAFRADKGVTLRELAAIAHVSPGYLSELERGRKEVSSEMLASVCHGLGTTVAEVLIEAAGTMVLPTVEQELAATSPAAAEA